MVKMYSKYAYGVPDTSSNEYDFLVSRDTYDAGVQLRNDTTSSSTGKKGFRFSHSSSDNANLDLRSSTGSTNFFSFRLQDDASPSSFSTMMTLTDDNKSSTSAYGMTLTGRAKASQYFVSESDTRTPTTTGLYIGYDSNTTGYFHMNPGANGTGGFKFRTYDSTGQNAVTNLSLDKFGYIAMPNYSATNDALDIESSSAIVSFDSTGKLVRDYQQNARLRSTESRSTNLESTVLPSITSKVNEIVSRMNAVAFFNSNIAAMDLGAVPLAYTAPAASVSLNMNVDLTTANSPSFQQSLIQSTASSLNINQSQVSIGSITSSTGLARNLFKTGSGVNIEIIIAPDPTGSVKINPTVAVQQLAIQAQSTSSPFVAALTVATGSNPVNTEYVPVTKVIPTNTPAPTTPAPTTPAPTTPAPTINGRYIKATLPGYGSFAIAEIMAYSSANGANIITPSMATSTSAAYNSYFNSEKAVDRTDTFFASYPLSDGWLLIDLGAVTPLYKITVKNRVDCCRDSIKGVVITILDSSQSVVYTSNPIPDKNGVTTHSSGAGEQTMNSYLYYDLLTNSPTVTGYDTPTTPAPTTPAPTTPAPTTPAPTQPPNTITTRYIKLKYGNTSSVNRYIAIGEVKVYTSSTSSNIVTSSMNVTATSSHPAFPTSNINDGNINSFWHAGDELNPSVQLDLGANTYVYMIVVAVRAEPALYGRQKGMVLECINAANQSVFTSGLAYGSSTSTTYSDNGDGYAYYYYLPAISTNPSGTNTEPSASASVLPMPTTPAPTTPPAQDISQWQNFNNTYMSGGEYYNRYYPQTSGQCVLDCKNDPNCVAAYTYNMGGYYECSLTSSPGVVSAMYSRYGSMSAYNPGGRNAYISIPRAQSAGVYNSSYGSTITI